MANPNFDFLIKMHGHIGLFTYPYFGKYSLKRLYHMHPDYFNPYKDCCNLIKYMLRGFILFSSSNLNISRIFMYISFFVDPYKYVVITSMICIFSHSEIVKLIKKQNVIVSMIGDYAFS